MTALALGGVTVARIGTSSYAIAALLGICLLVFGGVIWVGHRTDRRITDELSRRLS